MTTQISKYYYFRFSVLALLVLLTGCAGLVDKDPVPPQENAAELTPVSALYADLIKLPPPKGKILASVFGFRDQTGQYKKAPASTFSTAVTQGASSMLIKALLDSKWFIPMEREGLQDLLTERKIIRAAFKQRNETGNLPPLTASNVLLEGGVVAYETNIKTGGIGAKYFGLGASDLYRMDQVTVSLRAVDIRSGQILKNVFTTKTIFSYQLDAGVYRFIKFKRLLEAEAGFTRNEPAQLCVMDAIEAAVIHLIVQGVKENIWQLANPDDYYAPVFQKYLSDNLHQLVRYEQPETAVDENFPEDW
jgi:curli production assembly/transport component CsgG